MVLHLHLLQFYTYPYIYLYLYRLLLTTTSILFLPLRLFYADYSQPTTWLNPGADNRMYCAATSDAGNNNLLQSSFHKLL